MSGFEAMLLARDETSGFDLEHLRNIAGRCSPKWFLILAAFLLVTYCLSPEEERGGSLTRNVETRNVEDRRKRRRRSRLPPPPVPTAPRRSAMYSTIWFASVCGVAREFFACLVQGFKCYFFARQRLVVQGFRCYFTRQRRVAEEWDIAFYCGHGFIPGERSPWDGRSLAGGIGGSEQCLIRLARALDLRVVVFNCCDACATVDGVRYAPCAEFDHVNGRYNHVVVWRLPQYLLARRCLELLIPAPRWSTTFWVHDGSYLEILKRGFFVKFLVKCAIGAADTVVFPSKEMLSAQHAALFSDDEEHEQTGEVLSRSTVIPHGVPRYFFEEEHRHGGRADLLWPVSVERGLETVLSHLDRLEAAAIRGGASSLKLHVCHHRRGYHCKTTTRDLKEDPRVVYHGMLPPLELAEMYARCSLFVFPSSVPEAFSLSVWECMTHGVYPILYGRGALADLDSVGATVVTPGDDEALVGKAAELLADRGLLEAKRARMLRLTAQMALDWEQAAQLWKSRIFDFDDDNDNNQHRRRRRKTASIE